MKQRFSSLDVKVIAHELQSTLVTLRLANVYDLSSKILLLKFAKPDNKKQVIIDTGFRCHLTEFARTTAATPSAFVARLRKFLKTRRLTSVSQIGSDRILEFQFSDGQYRLFLEFFASGNIILTDADLKIIAIARNVAEGEGRMPQRMGLEYSLENTQNFASVPPLTKERVRDALKSLAERAASGASKADKKSKGNADLRKGLAVSITELPPVVIEHSLKANEFDPKKKASDILENETLLDELVRCLTEAREIVESITSSATCKGYIFAKRRPGASDGSDVQASTSRRDQILYEEFNPFLPHNLKNDPSIEVLEFDGYNRTVDEFYSSLEGQKLESRLVGREEAAERKIETARREQAKRIEGLKDAQAVNARKAAAIEANVERVQEAMDAVNGLLTQGMDWVDIGKLIEREKKMGNPVAAIINVPLKLSENTITLTLAEEEFDDEDADDDIFSETDSESEDESLATRADQGKTQAKGLTVDILLTMSPWGNARDYYDQRKSAAVKEEKTQQQAAKALRSTEQKVTEDLKKALKQEKALLQPIRNQMWFEKFTWFLSSDGYLVLAGRDSHQHDLLYSRHLRKGDVYCHADLRGSPSIVIKNNPNAPDAPIPPATLAQAGSLCVCTSEAWDSKAGMGAWWVDADQVTKVAPTGDVLPIGSFHIKGKKNFLPPTQLLLGFGVMFKISEDSKSHHAKHRLYDDDSGPSTRSTNADKDDLADQTPSTGDNDEEDESEEKNTEQVEKNVAGGDDDDDELEEEEGGKGEQDSDVGDEDDRRDEDERANPLQAFEGAFAGSQAPGNMIAKLRVLYQSSVEAAPEVSRIPESGAFDEHMEVAGESDDDDSYKEREEDNGGQEQEVSPLTSQTTSRAPSTLPSRPEPKPKKGTGKRGQKGKAKKIAQKYKHQDEEDKAAAEALIGATAGRQRAKAEAAARVQRQVELDAAKERRRALHQRRQEEVAQQEETRKAMMEEGAEGADDGESNATPDSLVGWPLPGDEILEAVPVCAPWNAMARFKYKVKLQPGAVKKGKAVKEILERWSIAASKKGVVDESARDKERIWPREIELIKTFKPEMVNNCVPVGKVKVMASGGISGATGGGGGGGGKAAHRKQQGPKAHTIGFQIKIAKAIHSMKAHAPKLS
ncbi:Uncharacterized protein ESCO_002366 [Escovopsis weberi]|uniref:Ribosome quality control complex subunit 2 n=1 Tax=Escovopsis weberi TaxID=150374 RepID=A0A0M8N890_ESCWE|nr:Uncharacterized protein ESCO_002366 [Escovopsis weberi]